MLPTRQHECANVVLERVAFNEVHPIDSNSQQSQFRFVLGYSQSESDWLQPV